MLSTPFAHFIALRQTVIYTDIPHSTELMLPMWAVKVTGIAILTVDTASVLVKG